MRLRIITLSLICLFLTNPAWSSTREALEDPLTFAKRIIPESDDQDPLTTKLASTVTQKRAVEQAIDIVMGDMETLRINYTEAHKEEPIAKGSELLALYQQVHGTFEKWKPMLASVESRLASKASRDQIEEASTKINAALEAAINTFIVSIGFFDNYRDYFGEDRSFAAFKADMIKLKVLEERNFAGIK